METVFVHPERCIGCMQCQAACSVAHSSSKNLFLSVFENPRPVHRIHVTPGLTLNTSFPNKCRHCNPAPCLSSCPTGAIYRPSDFPDYVDINASKCIACGMCAMVCPFDVITFHRSAAAPGHNVVAIKCDHCLDRQRAGDIPACVEACKVDALVFGEINELAQAARTRFSEAVSAAVGRMDSELVQLPGPITGLRAWGKAVTRLNEDGRKGA